jgi:hypothetical protein
MALVAMLFRETESNVMAVLRLERTGTLALEFRRFGHRIKGVIAGSVNH